MVERMKTTGAIRSPEVERAFLATPRHVFLPGVGLDLVYSGNAVVTRSDPKVGITSSSSEVAIMAPMLEALEVERGQRVLEVGVGTGYNAALLDDLVGPEGEVVSIDVQPDVVVDARAHLASAGHEHVGVISGDGYEGHAATAPYDRIIATASVSDIPTAWRDQLREGGLLVVPLRFGPGAQMIAALRRSGPTFECVRVLPGAFMPVRTEQQALEAPVSPPDDAWEATIATSREGDVRVLIELLRADPTLEPFHEVPWPVLMCLVGLVEPDVIVLRQRGRPGTWHGLFDRAAPGLVLLAPVLVPQREPRSALLSYGRRIARDRFATLVERLAPVKVESLRVRAVPSTTPRPTADVIVERQNFVYAIDWPAGLRRDAS